MDTVSPSLVARARAGDVEAYGELFRRTHRGIYNFVRQMVHDADDAADLTQEIYVRAYKGLKTLRADEAFLVWLHRIALNVVRDAQKHNVQTTVSLDDSADGDDPSPRIADIPDWSQEPERIVLAEATQEAVRQAVRSLPEIHRSVVTMHHLEGMEVTAIAQVLGVSPGTVLSRLARARETLRRKLSSLVEA
jgi:RNA polymerase sigma-70 factor (ECF subfamily)